LRCETATAKLSRKIIEAKIAGKEVAGFVEEEQPTVDIMTALKESIKQASASRWLKLQQSQEAGRSGGSKAEKARKSKAS